MAENLKTKTVKGVWWSFLEKYSTQGVSFIVTLVMARILTPELYGLIGMTALYMSLGQVFIDGGFANALIQKDKNRTDADFSTVFWINITISLITYSLLFVFAPLIAHINKEEILIPIIRIYGLNLIVSSLSAVNKVKLAIDINFKSQLMISLIAASISGVAGIICALNHLGVWAIVIQSNVSAVLTTILSFIYVKWKPALVFSKDSFTSLFRFGSKLLASQIINTAYVELYKTVIGLKYTKKEVGLYSKAGLFVQMVSTYMAQAMTRVSFPVLSRIQDDNEKLVGAYRPFITMVAFIVFPLTLGFCGIAEPLIVSLIGYKWIGAIPIIRILAFAYLLDGITLVNLNLLYVKGKSNVVLKLEIIKKSIAICILLYTVRISVNAICIGQVIYAFIALILNTSNTKKLLNYGFLHQIRDLLPYFLCSVIMAAVALGIGNIFDNYWLILAICIIVCPIVYFLLCYLFRLKALYEMVSIITSNSFCPEWLNRLFKRLFPELN